MKSQAPPPEPVPAEDAPGYISLSSVRDDGPWWWDWVVISLVMVVMVVVAIATLTNPAPLTPCQQDSQSQACLDQRFEECLATDKYSRAECIQLVGGGK